MNTTADHDLTRALKIIAWLSSRQYLIHHTRRDSDEILADISRRAREAVRAAQVSAS